MESDEDNKDDNVAKTEFVAREYQVEIFEKAVETNVIVFLPTGAGKTFIATMLIKHYMHELKRKYTEGGKRVFFLVNTTPLVFQQAEAIRKFLPLDVGEYTGDLNVDAWDNDTWLTQQDKYHVLVMTAQIYLNMLIHAFTQVEQACILIFDECHQAVNNHPMRQIMLVIEEEKKEHLPRILGLTAALINSNVKPERVPEEIATLEQTFHATVVRALNHEMALQYAANPYEKIMYYNVEEQTAAFYNILKQCINELEVELNTIVLPDVIEVKNDSPNLKLLNDFSSKPLKKTKLGLKDTLKTAEELGLYCADIAVLTLIVMIERFKLSVEGQTYNILCAIATKLHYVRKIFSFYLSKSSPSEKFLFLSTDKILKLKILLENTAQENHVLVFVERRSTAHCLFHLFDQLSKHNPRFKHIKAEYIIGTNQQMNSITRENLLNRRRNKTVMKKFNMGNINVLFASNVLEEGIDIRKCNLVIKFDVPVTFRSYTQSKGRARHKISEYIVMVPHVDDGQEIFKKFKRIENVLTEVLCKKMYSDENEECVDDDDDETFYYVCPSGSRFTALQAISQINRYCDLLPHDKFSPLPILWWVERVLIDGAAKFIGYLQLPINSAIKDKIKGIPRNSITSAKRLVAFQTCIKLFELGEFDAHLLPFGSNTDSINGINLFPLWDFENSQSKDERMKQCFFDKQYSHWECNSKPEPGMEVFLHILQITPDYPFPDTSRLQAFYHLLLHDSTFCILSVHSWPELPAFPLFMNVGKVKVEILSNKCLVELTQEEIGRLQDFQKVIFSDALSLLKSYHKYNVDLKTDDYIIAPVVYLSGSYLIDWNTVRSQNMFPEIKPKSFEGRLSEPVTEEGYETKVVIPWYRQENYNLKYVVTKVRTDETPESQFPSQNYKSYREYFFLRYNQKINDMTQPMLEVRAISSKINCLNPRSQYSRRQKKEDEGFEETLVPELCYLIEFPSWYLVKATLLPSALHRVHYLLTVEQLRQKIVVETQMGSMSPPPDVKWKELGVKTEMRPEEEIEEALIPEPININKPSFSNNFDLEDFFPLDQGEEIPRDISRILDVDLAGIVQSTNFFNKKVDPDFYTKHLQIIKPKPRIMKPVARLKFINGNYPGYGPEPIDILEAITAASSGDIINYERAELLGDCFLKLATSLCLFTFFPEANEGKLSQIKGKIVGNKNLFFAGLAINIPSLLKVNCFDYKDWKVPGFSLPPSLLPHLEDPKTCASILDHLTQYHLKSVELSEEHIAKIKVELGLLSKSLPSDFKSEDNQESESSDESSVEGGGSSAKAHCIASKDEYLLKHTVREKVVSDSVEALISVYLQNFGIEGGFKILNWLRIIPEGICNIDKILYETPESPCRNASNYSYLLPNIEELENNLGYTFKDRAFVLQALTHSSYNHGLTDCYQRYEFLGDAILDFLLTSYIYEELKELTPGNLTDLRSALVNNITFACLAVKYNFHKHVLFKACKLADIITKFVKFQESRNHEIGPEIFFLIEENEVQIAECVDVPKALGDVFESLVAAVYLDSGKNLNCVWRVVYNLMENELKTFSKEIPKNPIRLLYETFKKMRPTYGKVEVRGDLVIVPLEVVHNGINKVFHGIGENKYFAKTAAAKLALKYFEME